MHDLNIESLILCLTTVLKFLFQIACLKKYDDILSLLLNYGADIMKKHILTGNTPLHEAAKCGHIDAVKVSKMIISQYPLGEKLFD